MKTRRKLSWWSRTKSLSPWEPLPPLGLLWAPRRRSCRRWPIKAWSRRRTLLIGGRPANIGYLISILGRLFCSFLSFVLVCDFLLLLFYIISFTILPFLWIILSRMGFFIFLSSCTFAKLSLALSLPSVSFGIYFVLNRTLSPTVPLSRVGAGFNSTRTSKRSTLSTPWLIPWRSGGPMVLCRQHVFAPCCVLWCQDSC
jgi:hypothetical protein